MKVFKTLSLVISLVASNLSFAVSKDDNLSNALEVDECLWKISAEDLFFGGGSIKCLLRSSNSTSHYKNRRKCILTLINWEKLSNGSFDLTVEPLSGGSRDITCNSADSCTLELNRPSNASFVLLGVSRLCKPLVELQTEKSLTGPVKPSTLLDPTTPRTRRSPTRKLITPKSQKTKSSIDPVTCSYKSVLGALPDGTVTFFCSNFTSSNENPSTRNLTSSNFTSSDKNYSKCKLILTYWGDLDDGYLFTVKPLNSTKGGASHNSSYSCTLQLDRPSNASVVVLGVSRVFNLMRNLTQTSDASTAGETKSTSVSTTSTNSPTKPSERRKPKPKTKPIPVPNFPGTTNLPTPQTTTTPVRPRTSKPTPKTTRTRTTLKLTTPKIRRTTRRHRRKS